VPDSSDTSLDNSIPVLQEVLVPGNPAHARASDKAAPSAAEPGAGVTVHPVPTPQVQAFETPEPPAPFELPEAPEPFEPNSAFHFARAGTAKAAPLAPLAPPPGLDADVLVERLRGRVASYLTGEGRGVIEARCRDALADHTTWLVNQITREVALSLETEMTRWVREAVDEALSRRSNEPGITST
jgi:hypothetical protein